MLRTKLSDADEGGVAAGSGALDSPYLVDWDYTLKLHEFRYSCMNMVLSAEQCPDFCEV
jgi:hypothetical protein